MSKRHKIKWIVETFFKNPETVMRELVSYWHDNEDQQKILDGFSENTISNFPMPYGVAPNFVIDNRPYCVPMVIEESSVVAAASSAAKFWMQRGGIKTEIVGVKKIGQVHFKWKGESNRLFGMFDRIQERLIQDTASLTEKMNQRGGGIVGIELLDFTDLEENLYQIKASFHTCDSMGANFINSILEQFAESLKSFLIESPSLKEEERDVLIVMCILSNFTPECTVRAEVSCPIDELGMFPGKMDSKTFAEKFETAVKIAHIDPYRATTHNKGIFNGIDAVVLATGNDFRAVEACGHTYAARDGQYRSLSHCDIKHGIFRFWLEIPLAVGTVGGLTKLHPMARRSLELLGNPSAEELMRVIAATGLAQNFAAVKSLVTTGIQKGHMKMHLKNILAQFNATKEEAEKVKKHFENVVVSYSGVRDFLDKVRLES